MAAVHRTLSVDAVPFEAIRTWRDEYRRAMNCQIVHDSLHTRPGWTDEYQLAVDGETVGYGSVVAAGPWREAPALYELYVAPAARVHGLDLAERLLRVSGAPAIVVQSSNRLGLLVVHAFGRDVHAASILFEDAAVTSRHVEGAVWRHPTADEEPGLPADDRAWRGIIDVDGQAAASGGVLFHYNPPYGDIYMDVAEPYRRRGLGTLMVQELKRLCRERGFIPGARCDPANTASRRTLQRAGFAPCGHILHGTVSLP